MTFTKLYIAFKTPPPIGLIMPYDGGALSITSVNLQNDEGTFKLFSGVEEAMEWGHAQSLKQFPKWHTEHCDRCLSQSSSR